MKPKFVLVMMLPFLLMSMLMLTFNIELVKSETRTWTVDDDGPADFHTIQEAVDAASSGDTIFVHNGTYYENVVVAERDSLSLVGENKNATIIDGNGIGRVVYVRSHYVTITNFTVRNSGSEGRFGIYAEGARINIRNNIIANNSCGVRATSYANISDNIITNNDEGVLAHWYGYVIPSGVRITNNIITLNRLCGVFVSGAGEDYPGGETKIDGNLICFNDQGIYLGTGGEEHTVAIVHDNRICYNKHGISIDSSSHTAEIKGAIFNNEISSNNQTGIYIPNCASVYRLSIYHNNFINNTQQAYSEWLYDPWLSWDNGYPSGGNYWSDYTDVDFYKGPYQNETGSDGIWDHPYIIDEYNKDRYPFTGPSGQPEEYPPVAIIEAPSEALINEEVTFNGTDSYDPDGGIIVNYQWNFGDGNVTSTTNPTIVHAYTSTGTHTVTLIVTDEEESESEPAEHVINIYALRPIAVIKALDEGYVNEPLTFDGSNSYDPDGGLIVNYQWDFGDGTGSTEQNPTHTYMLPGTYEVTLVVTDEEDQVSDPATHIINIKSPTEAIQELIETIRSWNLAKGTEKGLTSKLEAAISFLDRGKEDNAIRKMMQFIDLVEAQRDKNKLTIEQAEYLISEAQRILNLIQG